MQDRSLTLFSSIWIASCHRIIYYIFHPFLTEFEIPSLLYISISYVLGFITWYILSFNLSRIYSCTTGYPVVQSHLLNNCAFSTNFKYPTICSIHLSILAPSPDFNFWSSVYVFISGRQVISLYPFTLVYQKLIEYLLMFILTDEL
jgi:hypothetical protein